MPHCDPTYDLDTMLGLPAGYTEWLAERLRDLIDRQGLSRTEASAIIKREEKTRFPLFAKSEK